LSTGELDDQAASEESGLVEHGWERRPMAMIAANDAEPAWAWILVIVLPVALFVLFPTDAMNYVPCNRFHDVPDIRYAGPPPDQPSSARKVIQKAMPPDCPKDWPK